MYIYTYKDAYANMCLLIHAHKPTYIYMYPHTPPSKTVHVHVVVLGHGACAPSQVVIAYEPVWAIGTGVTATAAQAIFGIAIVESARHSHVSSSSTMTEQD